MKSIAIALLISGAYSFPFVADVPGVRSPWGEARRLHRRQQPGGEGAGSAAQCPNNPNHKPAIPISSKYPYNGAQNGLPGKGKGGYQVPANVSMNSVDFVQRPC